MQIMSVTDGEAAKGISLAQRAKKRLFSEGT